jgi:hypothetical protein
MKEHSKTKFVKRAKPEPHPESSLYVARPATQTATKAMTRSTAGSRAYNERGHASLLDAEHP